MKLNTCSYYMSDHCFACVGRLDVKYSDFDKRWFVGPWIIKIKKPTLLCARSTWRENEQSKKHRSGSEKRKVFVYSIVKITKCYNYQTWQKHLLRNSRGAQRYVGVFLIVLFGRWLAGKTNTDHMEYMRKSWLKLFRIMLYIRETGRRLRDRFHEHLLDVKNNTKSLKAVCSAL